MVNYNICAIGIPASLQLLLGEEVAADEVGVPVTLEQLLGEEVPAPAAPAAPRKKRHYLRNKQVREKCRKRCTSLLRRRPCRSRGWSGGHRGQHLPRQRRRRRLRVKPGSHQAERSGAEGSGAEREKINPTNSVRRSGNSVNFKLAATGERSAKRCIIPTVDCYAFYKNEADTNKQLVAAVTAS